MFTTTRFDSWDLPEVLLAGLEAIGWEFATQVQRDTVPIARAGTDVIGQCAHRLREDCCVWTPDSGTLPSHWRTPSLDLGTGA